MEPNEIELQFQKSWYLDDLKDSLLPAIESGDAKDAVTLLYRRFARNAGDNDKGTLSEEAFTEFLRLTKRAATLLPDTALITDANIPEFFKRFLLRLRKSAPVVGAPTTVNIRSIMHIEGNLIIEGYFDTERIGEIEQLLQEEGDSPLPEIPEPEIVLCADGRRRPLQDAGHTCERRYFGRTLISFGTFEVSIKMSKISEDSEIYFMPASKRSDGEDRCRIVFAEPAAGISPGLGCLYKNFGDFALEYDPKKNAMIACRPSASRRIQNESRAFRCILYAKMPFNKKLAELALRLSYFATRWYFKDMRVRLYYDKIYMGGDNGQYQFMYSFDRCRAEGGPSGRHRYLASKTSAAYYELKRDGYKVHASESPYAKLVALSADVVLATRPNVMGFVGFNNFEKRWCADLFSAHVVCIQHGMTLKDVPQRQARYIDNTELYFCASEKEAEHLNQPVYGYGSDMLRLTGLPRYDGLVSDPYKIVLLAPTWRRSSAAEGNLVGVADVYNPLFTDTAYYNVYREILTDENLISLLAENGYSLRFLLHPDLSSQAPDFEEYAGDTVEIVATSQKGYEPYLKQAAILITDYNGVQFDFAYMEKPILYYQPDALPPTYDSSSFDYEADGFGPITKDAAALVSGLKQIMDENIEAGDGVGTLVITPDELYRERMRDFFVFHDRENRGRVYDVIEEEYGK
ncbi:MAG: CDP-glycerol glycerophosphotransferase family protein [Clostridiales Family XIII bacterium]|jgi:CDP-glycerol glycerophosphotransferase (TagB/SpsB family)|nr:CDP-glycerol glycerophosphotransferase family protein [Clostridiales Family XIII bacterium]